MLSVQQTLCCWMAGQLCLQAPNTQTVPVSSFYRVTPAFSLTDNSQQEISASCYQTAWLKCKHVGVIAAMQQSDNTRSQHTSCAVGGSDRRHTPSALPTRPWERQVNTSLRHNKKQMHSITESCCRHSRHPFEGSPHTKRPHAQQRGHVCHHTVSQ